MMKRVMSLFLASPVVVLVACSGGNGDGSGRELSITAPLNDTGITLCGDYAYAPGSATHNNNVNCITAGASQTTDGSDANGDIVPAGQDALYGRDVTDSSNSNGSKGFSFTKLDFFGVPLADQDNSWSDAGGESIGTKWSCVHDEVTDLVWEVKTNNTPADLRDRDFTFTWYNSDAAGNGGDQGFPDVFGIGIGSDNCINSARCDPQKYVADVNALALCGASDWRLPTRDELKTLRHLGKASPAIDAVYFPNTPAAYFWTATSRASDTSFAWVIAFDSGSELVGLKDSDSNFTVRLVRNAN